MVDTPRCTSRSRLGPHLGIALTLAGAPTVAKKKPRPDPVQQDPMETEANPQTTTNPTGGTGGTTGTGGGTSSTGSGSSTNTSSGGTSSNSSASSGGGGSGGPVSTAKIGRYMLSLKVGAAPCVYFSGGCGVLHQGVAGLEFAWAFTQSASAYLIVPVQVQFRANLGTLMLPVGIQYDIALPVPNLYIYPRLSLGYAVALSGAAGSVIASHYGVAIPEFGIKYVFSGRYHLGGEVVSLPILFNSTAVVLYYRAALSFGLSF